jgi:hypothetical protein
MSFVAARPLAVRRAFVPSALALAVITLAACQEATAPGEPAERTATAPEERTATAEPGSGNGPTPSSRPSAVLFTPSSGYTGIIAVPTTGGVGCTAVGPELRYVDVRPITVGAPPGLAPYAPGDNVVAVYADVRLVYWNGSAWQVLARKGVWSEAIQRNNFIVGDVNHANGTIRAVTFDRYLGRDGTYYRLPQGSYSVHTVLTWYAMNAMGSERWIGQRTVAYQHAGDYAGFGHVGVGPGWCSLLA